MGKVFSENSYHQGWPGAISRSVDDIVVTLKNAGDAAISFGVPVFLNADGSGVVGFDTTTPQDFSTFVGFAVRDAAKTPDTYPDSQDMSRYKGTQAGTYAANAPVDVLVRGSISVPSNTGGQPGGKVYVRKSDGKIVFSAGTSGTTVELENCRLRKPATMNNDCSEIVVLTRHIQ